MPGIMQPYAKEEFNQFKTMPAYNHAVEGFRDTEYPMLKGMLLHRVDKTFSNVIQARLTSIMVAPQYDALSSPWIVGAVS